MGGNTTLLRLVLLINLTTVFVCYAQKQREATFEMSFFEDVNSEHTFETVKQERFILAPENFINLGFKKSTIWVRLKLKPNLLQPEAVVEIKNALLDTIIISSLQKNNTRVNDTLGVCFPQSLNKLENYVPAFVIPTHKLTSPDVYLKVRASWPMFVDVNLLTKNNFNNKRTTTYLIQGLMIGCYLFIAIYNLFLFFSLRERIYLIYVLVLLSCVLSQGFVKGLFMGYLSPNTPEFVVYFPSITLSLLYTFSCWFTIEFLDLKKTSKFLYVLLLLFVVFSWASVGFEMFDRFYIGRHISIFSPIIISLIIMAIGFYSLIKGNKAAIYFTIAWFFPMLGVLLFFLQISTVIPHNFFTQYFVHIGSMMEVMLLSFALGYKYNLLRAEKERLERQTKRELESLVKMQTTELENSLEEKKVLLKEIHHRVKNNLQMVISLLDLQIASVNNNQNKEILSQSKARVHTMSLIHQKLYLSDKLSKVNLKDYLEELYAFVKNSFNLNTAQIDSDVFIENKELSLTQLIPLGLIVNELLTNSFKYGVTKNNQLRIKIHVKYVKSSVLLIVADTGPGFDEQNEMQGIKKSLGLFLVKSLSKQLRGKIIRYRLGEYFTTELEFPIDMNKS